MFRVLRSIPITAAIRARSPLSTPGLLSVTALCRSSEPLVVIARSRLGVRMLQSTSVLREQESLKINQPEDFTAADKPILAYESKRTAVVRFFSVAAISQLAAGAIASPLMLFLGKNGSIAAFNSLAPRIVVCLTLLGGGAVLFGVVGQLLKRCVFLCLIEHVSVSNHVCLLG